MPVSRLERFLPVEPTKQLVPLGKRIAQPLRIDEKGFAGNGEELGLVLRRIRIQRKVRVIRIGRVRLRIDVGGKLQGM